MGIHLDGEKTKKKYYKEVRKKWKGEADKPVSN